MQSDDEIADLINNVQENFVFSKPNWEKSSSPDNKYAAYFAPFEIITTDEILVLQKKFIDAVVEITKLDPIVALDLLKSFNWDHDLLMERFYEWDMDNSLQDPRLAYKPTNDKKTIQKPSSGSMDCDICVSEYSFEEMETMEECGHTFCKNCWKYYLQAKIENEGISDFICCMIPECSTVIKEDTVLRLLEGTKASKLYQKMILNNFVECHPRLKWCPGPGCILAAKVLNKEPQLIKCNCGFVYCFLCTDNWHHPVPCKFIKKWKKESSDNHLNQDWLASNTKECPKCSAAIEKNGGCNHMTCQNIGCRYEFCWICLLGPWTGHNCNNVHAINKGATTNLQRYNQFSNLFNSHKESLVLERKLLSELNAKYNLPSKESSFFRRAIHRLCECRRLLMDTFVFSYYLKTNNDALILEMNQKDLHHATESLSECLETALKGNKTDWNQDNIFRKSSYCWERRKILIDHITEGLVNEIWQYQE